jgi:hypothetical protein
VPEVEAMVAVTVEVAVVGRRSAGINAHSIDLDIGQNARLRDIVGAVVAHEVDHFRMRAEDQRLYRILTTSAIADALEIGVVRSGDDRPSVPVGTADAVATALQAFDDGLYRVFVEDEPVDSLDVSVAIRPGSRLTFLRLVALAGG